MATYNSAQYVIQALNSIKWQTYQPSEIIITDDGSTDDTLLICRDWLEKNPIYKEITKILSVHRNTGAVANYQRGYDAISKECEWVKKLDGDDVLTPNCLLKYKKFIEENPNAHVIASTIIPFTTESQLRALDENNFEQNFSHKLLGGETVEKQREYFDYFEMFSLTPTLIIKRDVFETVRNDIRIPMIGDVPFSRNLLYNNIKIYYMPEATVFYRVVDSISHSTRRFYNPVFIESIMKYRKYYQQVTPRTILGQLVRLKKWLATKRMHIFYVTLKNTPTPISSFLFNATGMFISKYNQFLIKIFFKFKIK